VAAKELPDEPVITDVLDRMVEWAAQGVDYISGTAWYEITTDCAAAADEIKRLRAALTTIAEGDSNDVLSVEARLAREVLGWSS
jgi:hypothetical protein